MDADKIVVHEVQSHCVCVSLNLLGKAIGQAREATHMHPHGQVLAFGK
jgi:hypothetical protein